MRIDAGGAFASRSCWRSRWRRRGAAPSRGSCGRSRTPSGSSSIRPTRMCIAPPGTSLSEAERRHPVQAAERAAGERHPDGWSSLHVRQDLLGLDAQPLCLPRARRLSQSQEPYDPGAAGRARRCADRRLQLADVAARAGARPARQGGDAALRHARAARRALSRRRLDQRRDRRPPGGGDGRARHRPVRRRHGRQLRLRRGQPGRARALLAGPHDRLRHRLQQYAALRLSRPHRRLAGDRRPKFIEENARWQDQACHRSLYSHQLRAALQLAVEDPAPRRDVRRLRLLGRGDDVRPVPRLQGQRVGAQSRPTCRRFPPSPRRSAAARARATTTCRRPITSTTGSPSSRAAWCSGSATRSARARSTCCSCRSAATTWASRGWSPMRCWPTSRSCAGSAAGSATCTASLEASAQLDALDDRLKSVNRAAAQPPACALAGVRPHHPYGLSADGAARRRQDAFARTARPA